MIKKFESELGEIIRNVQRSVDCIIVSSNTTLTFKTFSLRKKMHRFVGN
jgi:hypothetical protein